MIRELGVRRGRRGLLGGLAGVALVLVAFGWYRARKPIPEHPDVRHPAASIVDQGPVDEARLAFGSDLDAAPHHAKAADLSDPRQRADEVRERLRALPQKPETAAPTPKPPMAQDPDPAAAQAKFETYLRERMEKDFLPLTLQCYEQSAQPKGIGGRMVVRMVIVGDQTIGGVVESSEVDRDAGTLDDDWLSTCVKESLMAITFEPPPNGTRSVSVTYPFELRP